MTDEMLIKRSERVQEKLMEIRADMYDVAQQKGEGSPEHNAWRNACVYMREQRELVEALKLRLNS